MSLYEITKQSQNTFLATSLESKGNFVLHKVEINGKHFWQIRLEAKPYFIDQDESKAFLINKLQAGAYEDHFVEFGMVNGKQRPLIHRNNLLDPKTGEEGLAPLNVIHWWIKGEESKPYYSCDIHIGGSYFGGLGDTLKQAVASISSSVSLCLGDEEDEE